MGHQEGKDTDDEKRQHPHRVVPLVVQSQNAGKSCAGDDKNLRMKTHSWLENTPQQVLKWAKNVRLGNVGAEQTSYENTDMLICVDNVSFQT